MGLLESICVIYLRRLVLPTGVPIEQLGSAIGRWPIELVREACTLVMLLAVAWVAGFNWRSRAAYFFFTFGVWDILYYAGLKWYGGWPASWLEWDCLFLIPKPWYGPVLAPVLISLYFMLGCCVVLGSERRRLKLRFSPVVIGLQVLAMAVWYWSFVKDAELIGRHGYVAARYSWELLCVGMFCGLTSIGLALNGQAKATGVSEDELWK
jgi:hypothetical protein